FFTVQNKKQRKYITYLFFLFLFKTRDSQYTHASLCVCGTKKNTCVYANNKASISGHQSMIAFVKPPKVKDKVRLLEKIKCDYNGDYNQVFDKAEQFNLIVSEDKDFFEKQSTTHRRFHNIKLYVKKHDVYVEMQAILKGILSLKIQN
ncbi:hypothetical protein RFI_26477, partial [Reticulomyxa filosa]